MLNKKAKIYIAGHKGLVGSAILRKLKEKGYKRIIYKTSKQLDLLDEKKVLTFLKKINPTLFLLLPPKLGGFWLIISIKHNLFMKT